MKQTVKKKNGKITSSIRNYHWVVNNHWQTIWIMFDLYNGHSGGNTYFWVFGTKKEALNHRKQQHKMKFGAKLSYPQRISLK